MSTQQDPVSLLAARWDALMQRHNVSPRAGMMCFGDIVALYTRGRAYHTLDHLVDLFTEMDRHDFADADTVAFAIFYHDAVYGPIARMMLNIGDAQSATSDEDLSARMAQEHLSAMGIAPAMADRVAALILMTGAHRCDPEADRDAALFLDMDMSILGAAPARYALYAAQIRQEYSHIDRDAFCAGRKEFLERTLTAGRVFITDTYHASHGAQAAQNLRAEMNHLEATRRPFGPQP